MESESVLGLNGLEDVPVVLTAELERRSSTIREILRLRPGSFLPVLWGEGRELRLYVSDVPVAYTEVAGNEKPARVRLTRLSTKRKV